MRLHRLLGIIMLLDSRGKMKAGNLAKILETSERTIYRDIDILCEAGIPIQAVQGPEGGFSFMNNYNINSNIWGSKDILNLLLSTMGIIPDKNTETAQQLKNAVIKLENSVSEEHRKEIIDAKEKFFMDSEPWWGKRVEIKDIDIIRDAILKLRKLKITYKKYKNEVSERIIRPYGAIVKNSEWYIAAFCEVKNELRVFKCSRIENIEVLEETFVIPTSFNLGQFWEKSKTQFEKQSLVITSLYSYSVKLKLFKKEASLLNGFYIISFSETFDYLIYDVDMLSFETAISLIFPLSDRIEVIEPLELKECIIKKAEKIINLYKC